MSKNHLVKKKIQRVEPRAVIDGNIYKVCSLNIQGGEPEFFYHFAYPKDANEKIWNETYQEKAGRPDHISFHQDGHIHITLKGNNQKKYNRLRENSSFLPADQTATMPLLVHSIYPIGGQFFLPLLDASIEQNHEITNILQSNNAFSVIIFLTRDNINPENVLNQYKITVNDCIYSGAFLGSVAGRLLVWEGWAIDYILTDLTLPVSSVKKSPYWVYAYQKLPLAFRDFWYQRHIF